MKINDVILEKALQIGEAPVSAKVQGATGAKIAQTSGGQFMNKADRLNQAKVDAALGPGFIAGKANTNLALAKKFGQPAAAAPAAAEVDPTKDPYDPTKDTNVAQVDAATGNTSGMKFDPQTNKLVPDNAETPAAPTATAASADGNGASPGAAQAMANMGKPAGTPPAPADDLARMTTLAGAGKPAGGYGNFTGGQQTAALPTDQATASAPNPDTVAPANNGIQAQEINPIKSGGGNLATKDGQPVMSGSQTKLPDGTVVSTYDIKPNQKFKDKAGKEYVAQVNPMNKQVTFNRSFDGVGDFVSNVFGKKKPATAAPAPDANTPAATAMASKSQPLTQSVDNNAEISRMKKLSGL